MADPTLRSPRPEDADELARILFEAFQDIAQRHHFPPDFPTEDSARTMMGFIMQRSFGVVAERDGRILGSNFLAEGDPIAAVGPVSVDPRLQESGVGRRLMEAVIERGRASHGVRLVQDAFNATSMALYASLGFVVREPLVLVTGTPRSAPAGDVAVRPLVPDDLYACARLCEKVHGVTRTREIERTMEHLGPTVAERDGRVTAYATTTAFWPAAHAVAETQHDLRALLVGSAHATGRPLSFLLPTRQAELFHWALREGLRIVKPMTLMSMGPYQDPSGAFLPSVGY